MSVNAKIGVSLLLTSTALILVFVGIRSCATIDSSATEERLEARLEMAPVQLHLAVRERLSRDGASFAARLERAASESAEADAIARELLEQIGEGAIEDSGEPVLHHFGADRAEPDLDRLHVLLAMVWTEREADSNERMPTYVLKHEARALHPAALGPGLEGLGWAASVYSHAIGGYCDVAEPDAARVRGAVAPAALADLVPEPEREATAVTLSNLQRFLADGSLGCCAMREGDLTATLERLERSIRDAERLGVCELRLPLLKAWRALLRGDRDDARSFLNQVDPDDLEEDDRARWRVIRTALAIDEPDAAEQATLRSEDHRWISRLVAAGGRQSVRETRLAPLLFDAPLPEAARRMVAGEVAILREARRIQPFLERQRP